MSYREWILVALMSIIPAHQQELEGLSRKDKRGEFAFPLKVPFISEWCLKFLDFLPFRHSLVSDEFNIAHLTHIHINVLSQS